MIETCAYHKKNVKKNKRFSYIDDKMIRKNLSGKVVSLKAFRQIYLAVNDRKTQERIYCKKVDFFSFLLLILTSQPKCP